MVQNNLPSPAAPVVRRQRGRPRAYNPEQALSQALNVFWRDGFAATSLDDLSLATGMNRPSIYNAFGDKRALYARAFRHNRAQMHDRLQPIFAATTPLRQKLRQILVDVMELYLSGDAGPRGCFTVLTGASGLMADSEMRAMVVEAVNDIDQAFEGLFTRAAERGELPVGTNPLVAAQIASATVHTLSIRARAGFVRSNLEALIERALSAMCGAAAMPQSDQAVAQS